jgi:plastocyanin
MRLSTRPALAAFLAASLVPCLACAAGGIAGKVNAKAAKNKKNVVVFIEKAPYSGTPKEAELDQKNQVFIPFVLPVVKGTTVKFLNSDATGHNVFSPDGEKFDLGVYNKDEVRNYTFKTEGVYTILCKMHNSMIAYVIALQNPYYAVTGEDGSFKIEGVPPGEYTIKVWSERKKADPVKVTVAEGGSATADIELK